MTLSKIIETLYQCGQRASYGAVGEVLGLIGIEIGRQMNQRPRDFHNCWVVSKDSGFPRGGYLSSQIDPRLWDSPEPITSGRDLLSFLQAH